MGERWKGEEGKRRDGREDWGDREKETQEQGEREGGKEGRMEGRHEGEVRRIRKGREGGKEWEAMY